MAGPSTRRALGHRATGTANWLEYWEAQLLAEMAEQGITLYMVPKSLSDNGDDDGSFVMKRRDIRRLVQGMRDRIASIRQFEEKRHLPQSK